MPADFDPQPLSMVAELTTLQDLSLPPLLDPMFLSALR